MPCYHPLQASFSIRKDGLKDLTFSNSIAKAFTSNVKVNSVFDSVMSLPCGRCIGCRLEKSRQWAMRCMHEASLHEDNCFLTLTYRPDDLPVNGSLVKKHFQDFMKRYRERFSNVKIRYFACGEYGEEFSRPHYHACVFGHDFFDKKVWKTVQGYKTFTSKVLENTWGKGFCVIGSLTFDSAAYVARYCTKKISGPLAKDHYGDRIPEFGLMSRRPGIGRGWYDKWFSDCYPSDYLVVNNVRCKLPRYYDQLLKEDDYLLYDCIKRVRADRAVNDDDFTHRRLADREECQEARFDKLLRNLERSLV